jgi:thioredoxin reductase
MDDETKAKVDLGKAQTAQIDATIGLVPASALAIGRQNQLIEDGVYPGLEEAIADAKEAGDFGSGEVTDLEGNPIPQPENPDQQQFGQQRQQLIPAYGDTLDEEVGHAFRGNQYTGGIGGGGEPPSSEQSNYGLVPGDVDKFKELKSEWSRVNNELLELVDKPDSPEARAKLGQLEILVKQMQGLHADPGTPAGIGLPGGPRDVTIVGAGPGGLAAGINGAAEGLDTLIVEAQAVAGGQAKYSSRIENFGGFPIGVTGERLTQNMFEQAKRLGAEAVLGTRVTSMTYDQKTGLKHLTLSNGQQIDSRTVILAGGVEFRSLSYPGREGSGVFVGDGKALATTGAGGNVGVIGGSNGAAQAALGCAQHSAHVFLLARSPIAGSMSSYQIEALKANPKVTVIENDSIAKLTRDVHGEPEYMETVKGQRLPVKALGEFVGSMPDTKWLPSGVSLAGGRIKTDSSLEDTIPGVYAVGDMRSGAIGRIGVAYGEGQLALRQANVFLDKQRQPQMKSDSAAEGHEPVTTSLITRLFALDRDNPWFGQTVEGVKPLPTPKHRRDADSVLPFRRRV